MSDHLTRQLYSDGEDGFINLQSFIPNPTISGPQGPMGPMGPQGPKGDRGEGIDEYQTEMTTMANELADLKAYVATLNQRMHSLENPIVTQLAVMPAAGTQTVMPGESFSITVDPEGQDFYALEVDHNLEGILPEFTVYASELNPYGTQQSKDQFEALSANITYDATEMKWVIDFGPQITDIFRAQANVRFHFVVRDSMGNIVWGSMNPSTPENTRNYVIV